MSRYGTDPLGRPVPVIRILSGIQPTGEIHLDNYLGALPHWVTNQADAKCLYLLADFTPLAGKPMKIKTLNYIPS